MNSALQKKVLTIDDEPSVRLLIRTALQHERGIEILEAGDGVEGLEAIRRARPDLVLLDVVMPRLDGIKMLLTLRAEPEIADTPVILLTGYKDQEKLLPLLEQKQTDFLAKPFLLELLRQKVQHMLFPEMAGSAGNEG